jgi:hypothetical protein
MRLMDMDIDSVLVYPSKHTPLPSLTKKHKRCLDPRRLCSNPIYLIQRALTSIHLTYKKTCKSLGCEEEPLDLTTGTAMDG